MARKLKSIESFENPRYLIKSMLDAIERTNGGKDNLNFKELCDKHNLLFGVQGSEKRNKFQIDWAVIKKRPFKNYVELLDKLKVLPGTRTARRIQQLGDDLHKDDDMTSQDETSNQSSNAKANIKATTGRAHTPPPALTPVRTPPPAPFSPMRSQSTSTSRAHMRSSPVPPSMAPPRPKDDVTVPKQEDMEFEFTNLSISDPPTIVDAAKAQVTASLDYTLMDGTKNNPFAFVLKDVLVEGNRHPFGFFARLKAKKKVGRRGRLVLEIIKCVGANADDWVAEIVTEGTYAWRSVYIIGPELDYWVKVYLTDLNSNENDPNAKPDAKLFLNQHNNKEGKIYYQLILPAEGMWFDNHAISNDDIDVNRVFKKMEGKVDLFKGKHIFDVLAIWEIAIFDEDRKHFLDDRKAESASDLF